MIALVVVGLAVAQGSGFAFYHREELSARQALHEEFALARIASVARLVADTAKDLHPPILAAASSKSIELTLSARSGIVDDALRGRPAQLREALSALSAHEVADIRVAVGWAGHEGSVGSEHVHDDEDDGDDEFWEEHRVLAVALRLGPEYWLNARYRHERAEPFWQAPPMLSFVLATVILSVTMVVVVRWITRPLDELATAADRFGCGESVAPLAERGPRDLRDTIRAFNRMRGRSERFVHDRTRMLGAISHDLRTPIAALRVRAEMVTSPDARSRILTTLDEMQRMVEATLEFVRGEADREETRLADLDALVESVCNDFIDVGAQVDYASAGKLAYRCRSVSLKRALRNVVDNAVRYGTRAELELAEDPPWVRIRVADDGPGIPEGERERVFEPFVRMESSRSRETGGAGLGLAIARSIVRGHGGEVVLGSRSRGGLEVTILLPTSRGS